MPITPTYPGIYIQELPNTAHTITASPTNVAVFVGYTHPFKTKQFGKAIELFSFTDYEREFGGLFHSGDFPTDVAYAVYQFFLNGGTTAYVVGLQPQITPAAPAGGGAAPAGGGAAPAAAPAAPVTASTADAPPIVFSALVLPDADHALSVQITNLQASVKAAAGAPALPLDTADVVITYGSQAETYRKVSLDPKLDAKGNVKNPNFIANRIGTPGNPISGLVTVPTPTATPPPAAGAPPPAAGAPAPAPLSNYPTAFTPVDAAAAVKNEAPLNFPSAVAQGGTFTMNDADFLPVFQQDSSLDKLPIFNLLILPGITDAAVLGEALSFCERKQAFLIMDPSPNDIADQAAQSPNVWIGDYIEGPTVQKSPNGALYFPYLKSPDPLTGNTLELPPSGFVAGVYCRTDDNRGVWKAPAGLETVITNTVGVVDSGMMNDMRQGSLNPLGVNCLRQFPGIGTVVYGARTLTTENPAFEQWRYVPVRRMALFLEQTLYRSLGWVVFEPNDTPLWVAIRTSIEAFMLSLFHQGAFQGDTPSKAFQVKCDSDTTTQTDIDNGIVNIIVAFAPLKPAEFVIVKIAQLTGQSQA